MSFKSVTKALAALYFLSKSTKIQIEPQEILKNECLIMILSADVTSCFQNFIYQQL